MSVLAYHTIRSICGRNTLEDENNGCWFYEQIHINQAENYAHCITKYFYVTQ